VTMAPVLLLSAARLERTAALAGVGESAWETQASCRHGHFGPKPASHGFAVGTPKGSDFGPGKVGVN
jgi:hypothetical protein